MPRNPPPRFRPVDDPADSYSPWDRGWRLGVAWAASLLLVLLAITLVGVVLCLINLGRLS